MQQALPSAVCENLRESEGNLQRHLRRRCETVQGWSLVYQRIVKIPYLRHTDPWRTQSSTFPLIFSCSVPQEITELRTRPASDYRLPTEHTGTLKQTKPIQESRTRRLTPKSLQRRKYKTIRPSV